VEGGYTVTNPFSTTNCWRACLVPLESERGTQNGFLPEQKAGLATGTAKGLRDHPAGDTESHTMRFFPGNSRFNFGAIRGSDCTVRFRVSDTIRGT